MNKFLEPYGLEYNRAIMQEALRDMRAAGVDVRTRHKWDKHGAWLENRPLKDEQLKKLIFAVDSNPYLTKEQVTEILQALAPLVTVYQEPQLAVVTEKIGGSKLPQNVQKAYMIMSEAIGTGTGVVFTKPIYRSTARAAKEMRFSPKQIDWIDGHFYAVGYHHGNKRIERVDLHDITAIRPARYNTLKITKEVEQAWSAYKP